MNQESRGERQDRIQASVGDERVATMPTHRPAPGAALPAARMPGRGGAICSARAAGRHRPPRHAGSQGRATRCCVRGLYDLVADEVYGLAKRIVRDAHLSEEVAQEVLVEAEMGSP